MCFYLVNHIEILLHDHFSGCNEIAKSLGMNFSSLGASPLGMKNYPLWFAISLHPSKWSCNNILHKKLNCKSVSRKMFQLCIQLTTTDKRFHEKFPIFNDRHALFNFIWYKLYYTNYRHRISKLAKKSTCFINQKGFFLLLLQ